MSLVRTFHYTCDFCGSTGQKNDYGLPKGWGWTVPRMDILKHGCPICVQNPKNGTFFVGKNTKIKVTHK